MCRSRQELSNEYLLANFGVDTAENETRGRFRSVNGGQSQFGKLKAHCSDVFLRAVLPANNIVDVVMKLIPRIPLDLRFRFYTLKIQGDHRPMIFSS